MRHRLSVYREQTEPLVGYYDEADARVVRVDGDRPVEEVEADVRAAAGEGARA